MLELSLFYSYSAAELYYQTKYPSYPECSQSCVRMDVEAKFKTKSLLQSPPNRSRTTFIFPMEVPVTEEFYTASPLSLGKIQYHLLSEYVVFSLQWQRLEATLAC